MAGEDSTIDVKPLLSMTILSFSCLSVSHQHHTSDGILVSLFIIVNHYL